MNRRFALLLLGTLLAAGCRNPLDSGLGTLEISFSSARTGIARTILSDLDTVVDSYDVLGSSPFSEGFTDGLDAGVTTFTRTGLIDGPWTVTVNAVNAAGGVIMTGSTTVYVSVGATATADVVLSYIAGTGSLSFALEWPSDLLSKPAIRAVVEPASGATELPPPEFEVDSDRGVATYAADFQAGYYVLSVTLEQDGDPVWGCEYAVHIQAGAKSSELETLTADDLKLSDAGDP